MRLYDHTCGVPEMDLALDEALLLDQKGGECLRLWEPTKCFVVLGRSSRYEEEVDAEVCRAADVPILRRVSGGATIVTGPGCLMYGVVLDLEVRPELLDLTKAHRYALGTLVEALKPLEPSVTIAGTSDLAITHEGSLRKCSGNSVRRVRNRLLYHGTLLYSFDLSLVGSLLKTAPRQPDYRQQRDHTAFIANLNAARNEIVERVALGWAASSTPLPEATLAAATRLVEEKYSKPEWNLLR